MNTHTFCDEKECSTGFDRLLVIAYISTIVCICYIQYNEACL